MKVFRPETYANDQLRIALSFNDIDMDSIHDARVSLRKYMDVISSIYLVYENSECLYLAKRAISLLGKVRDMDICNKKENRDLLAKKAMQRVKSLSSCYIPQKIYGSRLLIFNRIIRTYKELRDINDFHELRKKIRTVRNLVESLGYDNREIKNLAKKMGDVRDEMLKMECNGLIPPNINLDLYKEKAVSVILDLVKNQKEFHLTDI